MDLDRISKLGIIAIAKKNHQKDEIYQFVAYCKDRFSKEEGTELMLEEKVLFDEAEIAERAKKMEKDDADLIVLIVGTWIYSSIVISAVNNLSTPFVLYGLSDRIANGNLGASLQIRYVLKEMGKNLLYLSGKMADENNYNAIMKYLKAAWVKKYLRNRKYLYTSNRGHDSITAFKIDRTSGKLELISYSSTQGEFPRDFAIRPTGKYLLVANQKSNTIVPFLSTEGSGKLEQVGNLIDIPNPVCIKFMKV